MRKMLALLMILLIMVSIAACGEPEATTTTSATNATTNSTTVPPTTAPIHVHEYTCELRADPTCAAAGALLYQCECGDQYTEEIPMLEHTWSNWLTTTPSTLTEKGQAERNCSSCSATESMELDVLTIHEAIESYARFLSTLPTFTSADKMTENDMFHFVRVNAGFVSSDWNSETYAITLVFSLDTFDAFTTYYLGCTYPFASMADRYEEFTLDTEKNQLIWQTYGAGGGMYEYVIESYEQVDDTHYTVRYAAKEYDTNNIAFYGIMKLVLTDGRLVIASHTHE